MNEKIVKPEDVCLLSKEQIKAKCRPVAFEEECYSQLNKSSFEQDFKALLGHYKNDQRPTRLSLK